MAKSIPVHTVKFNIEVDCGNTAMTEGEIAFIRGNLRETLKSLKMDLISMTTIHC